MAYDPGLSAAGGGAMSMSGAGTAALSTKLDLDLSLRNIPKMDLMSPSDPFIIVSMKPDGGRYKQIASTEIVWDNPNPNFSDEISLEYRFEEVQTVRLDVYDADEDTIGRDLSKHDYIGYCEFVLGDCVTADGQKLALKLKDKRGRALMNKSKPVAAIARVQELADCLDEFHVVFGVKGLPKMDWFGKADPFLEVYRQTEGGDWASMHRTEYHKNTLKCTFKPVVLSVRRLCNGDVDRPVLIRCFDWNKSSAPDFIGECELTLAQLTGETSFDFYDPSKKKKKARGSLLIVKQKLVEKFSFYQFITGGLDINLIVAIDFTGSNGDPRDTRSLHYMGPPKYESDYLRVIKSVGRILESYDNDGMIPVFGFGANIAPPRREISHCFPLTFRDDPEVAGIDGVISAYTSTLRRVQLYGPTYFSEILATSRAMSCHEQRPDALHWTILLIITDGIINDMQRTIDEVVTCSYTAALSIIIVGVGKGDAKSGFKSMEVLDADDEPLVAKSGPYGGRQMAADMVQFVEFDEYKDKHIGALAKEVLIEVPGQCEDYMARHGYRPGVPRLKKADTMTDLYDGPSGLAAAEPAPAAFSGHGGAYGGGAAPGGGGAYGGGAAARFGGAPTGHYASATYGGGGPVGGGFVAMPSHAPHASYGASSGGAPMAFGAPAPAPAHSGAPASHAHMAYNPYYSH